MKVDQICELFAEDPTNARCLMFLDALNAVMHDCDFGKEPDQNLLEFGIEDPGINYAHFCEELGWPNFQDGGIFEQMIALAVDVTRKLYTRY